MWWLLLKRLNEYYSAQDLKNLTNKQNQEINIEAAVIIKSNKLKQYNKPISFEVQLLSRPCHQSPSRTVRLPQDHHDRLNQQEA
jgi:hypothetical protein